MAWRNSEGYRDPTFGSVVRNLYQPKYKPQNELKLPPKKKVHDMTYGRGKTWEVFMHYVGYHDPNYGIWVRVNGDNEREAHIAASLQTVTEKPVEIKHCIRV